MTLLRPPLIHFFILKNTFENIVRIRKKKESAMHELIQLFWVDSCKNLNPTQKNVCIAIPNINLIHGQIMLFNHYYYMK